MPTSPEYYQKNKARILDYSKKRYLENKEALLEYQREYRKKHRKLLSLKSKEKRLSRWIKAIELLGGKCSRCGESFDPVCYDLHHTDPKIKEFTIGENMLVGKEKFLKEIQKCILVCSNCHRLIHKEINDKTTF